MKATAYVEVYEALIPESELASFSEESRRPSMSPKREAAHWMRDDRDVPADALDRIFSSSDPATAKLE